MAPPIPFRLVPREFDSSPRSVCARSDRPTRGRAYWRLRLFYGLIAATRRVAAQGPAPYQKRAPSDRRSVIFSPQASSSLAYARVWRMSAIASLPPCLSTRAASRSAFARSPAPGTL